MEYNYQAARQRIECKDGFGISVQASENHYCNPRMNGMDVKYSTVELGFPTYEESLITDYAQDTGDLTDTVYTYVPANIIADVIEKHGGIVSGEIPNLELDVEEED